MICHIVTVHFSYSIRCYFLCLLNFIDVFQISEVECVSLTQRSKIEELEAQLNEAEDTVKSLREQLEIVQNGLDEMKQRQKVGGKLYKLGSIDKQTLLNQRAACNECYSGIDDQTINAINTDLASIIMRSKEPEFFRNVCTERFRTLEQSLLHGSTMSYCGKLSSTYLKGRSEIGIKEDMFSEAKCRNCTCKNNNTHPSDNLSFLKNADSNKREELKFFQKFARRKRGRCSYVKVPVPGEILLEQGTDRLHEVIQNYSFLGYFKVPEDTLAVSIDEKTTPQAEPMRPLEVSTVEVTSAHGMKLEFLTV